jgi:hypothetical protein
MTGGLVVKTAFISGWDKRLVIVIILKQAAARRDRIIILI